MRLLRVIVLLLLGSASCMAGGFLGRFFDRSPEVIINTNVTEAGEKLPPAGPKTPIYYEGMSLGFTEFSRSIAGEQPPKEKDMTRLVTNLLRQQGYFPASPQHQATQYLVLNWGTYRQGKGPVMSVNGALLRFMGGEKLGLMWESEQLSMTNSANALRRHIRDSTSELIVDIANGDVYLFSIKAFDLSKLIQDKVELLWETNIACPADGLDIAETIPFMAKMGAPAFGRATERPSWVDKYDRYKGKVNVGEADVISMEPADDTGFRSRN